MIRRNWILYLFCWAVFATTLSGAISNEEKAAIRSELQQPIQVYLNNGRSLPGHSIQVSDGSLKIGSAEGSGEIIYTLKPDEIVRFEIPGEHYKSTALAWHQGDRPDDASFLFERLYQQRVNLIPLLPASESHFFCYYAESLFKAGNYPKAIAVAEVLRPQVTSPEAIDLLDDITLASYQNLELYDQATVRARAWVEERKAFGDSALGYYVLADQALRLEAFDEALQIALQPIVFSTATPKAYLAESYAAAISAAIGQREKDYARTLYLEMQERDLLWPESVASFQPYFAKLQGFLEDDSND